MQRLWWRQDDGVAITFDYVNWTKHETVMVEYLEKLLLMPCWCDPRKMRKTRNSCIDQPLCCFFKVNAAQIIYFYDKNYTGICHQFQTRSFSNTGYATFLCLYLNKFFFGLCSAGMSHANALVIVTGIERNLRESKPFFNMSVFQRPFTIFAISSKIILNKCTGYDFLYLSR